VQGDAGALLHAASAKGDGIAGAPLSTCPALGSLQWGSGSCTRHSRSAVLLTQWNARGAVQSRQLASGTLCFWVKHATCACEPK